MEAEIERNGDSGQNGQFRTGAKIWTAKGTFLAGCILALAGVAALPIDGPLSRRLRNCPPAQGSPDSCLRKKETLEGGSSRDLDSSPSKEERGSQTPENLDSCAGRNDTSARSFSPQQSRSSPHQGANPPPVKIPGELKRLITWAEGFGHGFGVLLIGLLVYQLDPGNRRRLLRAICMGLISGLVADGMKLLVGRVRPRAFDLDRPILESFIGLLPGTAGGSAEQSFPSAHMATAAGWALALGWMYPRGRWTFVLLAFLVLCQRVESLAHFLSDGLVGAAVGCWVSALFLPGGWLHGPFQRWETSTPWIQPSATTSAVLQR